MRVRDIAASELECKQHVKGEHAEAHGIWNIHTKGHKGYSHHPETKRWKGHLPALKARHDELVKRMGELGINHFSPLWREEQFGIGPVVWPAPITPLDEQRRLLRAKGCGCCQ